MKKIGLLMVLMLSFLFSCGNVKFKNPTNEIISDVLDYNSLVKQGAEVNFENYFFIDLRPKTTYLKGFVSNFHINYNLSYSDKNDMQKIVQMIEKTNKASFSAPIILLDTGEVNDDSSSVVYEALVALGYLNVKDIILGYNGLKEAYQLGYPYILKDSNDCGCE